MRIFRLIMIFGPCITLLLAPSCLQTPPGSDSPTLTVPIGDVVPLIQYPDVYLVSQGFGFNLPQGWSGTIDQDRQTVQFTHSTYMLTVYYDDLHEEARALLSRFGSLAGTVAIDGFWNDTLMDKFRLIGPTDASTLVMYVARDPLNGFWLTVYLECLGEGCEGGIHADIEGQAEWLLASYEEHGWEE